MSLLRRPRDLELLDALDALERIAIEAHVWRVVREKRDPLLGQASSGRWDPGTFDALYTSLEPDGAMAEMYFQLSRQPVFPSKVTFTLNEISVKTKKTLRVANLAALQKLGVDEEMYSAVNYERTQMIGDAAQFLGFDGIVAPSARWPCLNLVIFTDCVPPSDLELASSEAIDWREWRSKGESQER
jgi:RES domain-containing protein